MYKKIKSVIRKIFPIFFTLATLAGILLFVFYCLNDNNLNKLKEGERTLKSNKDFKIMSEKEVKGIPDNEVFQNFSDFQKSFSDLNFSLSSNVALAQENISKKVEIAQDKNSLTSSYELKGVTVTTDYQKKKKEEDGKNISLQEEEAIKQTIKIKNHTNEDQTITFTTRTKISSREVRWDGRNYKINAMPQYFQAYEKTSSVPEYAKSVDQEDLKGIEDFKDYEYTYKIGTFVSFEIEDGQQAVFDWSDAVRFNPEISVYRKKGEGYLEFTVRDFPVPAGSEKIIDPNFTLNNSSNFSQRYDGEYGDPGNDITYGGMAIGDINDDGKSDLVIGSYYANFNGSGSGSVFVIFGGLVSGSGNKKIEDSSNFSIRFDGGVAGEYLGNRGIFIGDVNGDSQTDLAIGTSEADHNGTNSGSAYIFYSTLLSSVTGTGNIMDLNSSSNYNIRIDGANASDYLTESGIVIGDVNGDSYDDLIIGSVEAPSYDEKGYAYVFYSTLLAGMTGTGNTAPLSTSSNYNIRFEGENNYDYLTQGTIEVGDVNGDGYSDLILGTEYASYGGPGSAFILYSSLISGITGTGNIKNLGTAPDNFNIRIDGETTSNGGITSSGMAIGDVNGDGQSDLILGDKSASGNGSSSGSAYIFYSTLLAGMTGTGNTAPLDNSSNYNVRFDGGAAGESLGNRGIVIGDANGDSQTDLAIGTSSADYNGSDSGSAYIFYSTLLAGMTGTGNTAPLSTSSNYNIRFDGGAASEYLGSGGIVIGDVNGDSQTDLAIGTSNADYNGTDSGSVYIFYSTLLAGMTGTGNTAPLSTSSNYNVRFDGGAASESLAYDGIVIGDANGDNHADLAIGTSSADYNGSDSGSAYIFLSSLLDNFNGTTGNNLILNNAENYTVRYDGSNQQDELPKSGIAIGDVNGDEKSDLVFGTYVASHNGVESGSVYVVFGGSNVGTGKKPLGVASNYNVRFDGGAASESLGNGGIVIGDANGDNHADLAIGTSNADYNGTDSGSVYIFYSTLLAGMTGTGNTAPLSTSSNYNVRFDGGAASESLAYDGIVIGDANGDSQTDLAIGTNYADYNGDNSGSVYIFYSTLLAGMTGTGNTAPLSTSSNYNIRFDGGAAGECLTYGDNNNGMAIGDVNGDSKGDLILEASKADYNGSNSGSVYVFYSTLLAGMTGTGNTAPLSTSSNYNIRFNGGKASEYLGNNGIVIGDINGDYLNDMVLGTEYGSYYASNAGSVYVFYSSLLSGITGTGNDKNLNTTSNFNIRCDGPVANALMTDAPDSIVIGDINGDGKGDLVIGNSHVAHNYAYGGMVYVMYSTLLSDITGTGNVRVMYRTSSATNVIIEGGSYYVVSYSGMAIGDVNGDGASDLIIGAYWPGVSDPASVFVFYSTFLDDIAGTGNFLVLNNASTYNIRYIGGASYENLGYDNIAIGDVNGDDKEDLVLGAYNADYNGTDAGSVYTFFADSFAPEKVRERINRLIRIRNDVKFR